MEGKALSFDDIDMRRPADRRTVLASVFDFGQVSSSASSRHVLLAYDDTLIRLNTKLRMRPYRAPQRDDHGAVAGGKQNRNTAAWTRELASSTKS